jgi:hypothetical protein
MKNIELTKPHQHFISEVNFCEICPGRARFEVMFLAGPLYFCGHHFDKQKQHMESMLLGIREIHLENE